MPKRVFNQPNKQPKHAREISFQNEMAIKGIHLVYEPRTFYLSNGSRYTPDFCDPKEDKYYELAGTRQAWHENKNKINHFKKEHPHIKFEIVFKYRKNQKTRQGPGEHKSYLLRGVPLGLWRKFRAVCKLEGTTVKQKLLKFIESTTLREI